MEVITILELMLYYCGRYSEAREVFQEFLYLREVYLGKEHTTILQTLAMPATVLGRLNDFEAASEIMKT